MVATNHARRRPMDDVLQDIERELPAHAAHFTPDREWLWYCGPSLQDQPEDRAALKRLGFRFAPRGHAMPDGSQGSWGHCCERPLSLRRRSHIRHFNKDESTDAVNALRDLFSEL